MNASELETGIRELDNTIAGIVDCLEDGEVAGMTEAQRVEVLSALGIISADMRCVFTALYEFRG